MKKTLFAALSVAVLCSFGLGIVDAQAQFSVPPGQPIHLSDIGYYITYIANFLIAISIVIAVIAIMWSGITYMTAGADDSKVKLARQRLVSAVIGALIVLAVGVILRTTAALVSRSFFS